MQLLTKLIFTFLLMMLLTRIGQAADIETLISQELSAPDNQLVKMLTVTMAPGEHTIPHRHNATTLVYVVAGDVLMQLKGHRPEELRAGQSFYESPTDIHTVSRNLSNSKPAKLLVVFVKKADTPDLIPVPTK